MTTAPGLVAIGCMIPVSGWWLLQMTTTINGGGTLNSYSSIQAVQTLVLLQVLTVTLFAPIWATTMEDRSPAKIVAARIATPVFSAVLPAWPLLAMLWLASGIPVAAFAILEAGVLAAGVALGFIAVAIRRPQMNPEMTRLVPVCLGLTSATIAWVLRSNILGWLAP